MSITAIWRQPHHGTCRIKSLPENRQHDYRQIRRRRHRERQRHQERHIRRRPQQDRDRHRHRTHYECGDPRYQHLFACSAFHALMNHIRPQVVRKRCRRADRQSRHHRQDRRKRNRRDERKEDIPGQRLRQQRSAHIRSAMARDVIAPHDRRRSKSQERRHDVEAADQHHRPYHALPRRLRVRHRVEPHQDMRQPGRPEDQRQSQRDQVQCSIRRLETQPRRQKVFDDLLPFFVIGHVPDSIEERGEAEAKVRQHQDAQQQCSRHQQNRLDDLHPGRRQHSAEYDIDNHQYPDANYRRAVADTRILQQQRHQQRAQ